MQIHLNNLGALEQAEFALGDLTIICGGNNTGKTYATYALYGFLSGWREGLSVDVPQQTINQLLAEGVVHIDVNAYAKNAQAIVTDGCSAYSKHLPVVFAAPEDRFKDSQFAVTIDTDDISWAGKYERRMNAAGAELFYLTKAESSNDLVVTLLSEKIRARLPPDLIEEVIGGALKDIVFGKFFPNPFIASVERTGAAVFRKELNYAHSYLLEEISQANDNVDPWNLMFESYQDYALPVKANVDFTRQLETLARKNSFIARQHPEVLSDFADIVGGEYRVTKNESLYYIPKGKSIKLTTNESSSSVRSLFDIGFYLKHMAKPGDLLMVDEPELNLHPENQRRVARLFARLVNLGIKVFITTHSDYIVKELNTLIMLNHDKPHLKRVAEREGYKPEELISAARIKVYIAEKALIKKDGKTRKSPCQTLTPAEIDPMLGIEARSFDTTIEAMNRIQEEIVWGDA